jgi:hypothetical protein
MGGMRGLGIFVLFALLPACKEYDRKSHGARLGLYSKSCHPRMLREQLKAQSKVAGRTSVVADYLKRCESELLAYREDDLLSQLIKEPQTIYDLRRSPFYYKVNISGLGGNVIELNVFQKDSKPRDWILGQCGLHCDFGTGMFERAAMTLFDGTDANLVLIRSHSSNGSIVLNRNLRMGGYFEGRHLLMAAQYLKGKSFSKDNFVKSIRLAGGSLGGHSVFFASLYDQMLNPDQSLFATTFNACPVVSLEPALEYVYRPGLIGEALSQKLWDTFTLLHHTVPGLADLYDQEYAQKNHKDTAGLVTRIMGRELESDAVAIAKENRQWLAMVPNDDIARDGFASAKDYFDHSNFQKYAHRLKNPMAVWASKDDQIVETARQSATLAGVNPNLSVINSTTGNHCNYSRNYTWAVAQAIEGELLGVGPLGEWSPPVTLGAEFRSALGQKLRSRHSKFAGVQWTFDQNANAFVLALRYRSACQGDSSDFPNLCYYLEALSGPQAFAESALPQWLRAHTGKATVVETQIRWLNAHTTIWNSRGEHWRHGEVPVSYSIERIDQD